MGENLRETLSGNSKKDGDDRMLLLICFLRDYRARISGGGYGQGRPPNILSHPVAREQ